jgi:hypothetical protein
LSDKKGPPSREGANSLDEAIREVPTPLARMIHHREHRGHREDGTKSGVVRRLTTPDGSRE